MGGWNLQALPVVVAMLGVEDVEFLVEQLETVRDAFQRRPSP